MQAVEQLGVDKAVPSRILELMGIDCLTRHNVASHLQVHVSDPSIYLVLDFYLKEIVPSFYPFLLQDFVFLRCFIYVYVCAEI